MDEIKFRIKYKGVEWVLTRGGWRVWWGAGFGVYMGQEGFF